MGWFTTLLIVVSLLLAKLGSAQAQQQVDPHDSQALTFYFHTTPVQEKALNKYVRPELDKAEKGNRPVEPRVAMLPGMIVISLESVLLCDWLRGCPVLVFRDITKAPVLKDYSYQNISITQRPKGTYLILRGDGPDMRECLIPKTGRAKCTPAKVKK